VRVLFCCGAEYGHLHSQLPLARAVEAAGHEAAFALPPSFHPRAEKAGFRAFPAGLDRQGTAREVARRFPNWADVPAEQRMRFALTNISAQVAAPAMAPELVEAIRTWGAELVVHGPAVFAAPLAAAATGIPSVNHSWGPLFSLAELGAAADAVAPLWREWSLEPPPWAGMFRYLYLDVCPPSLQTPEIAAVEVAHPLRPVPADAVGDEAAPRWLSDQPPAPLVYVTMGTFYNRLTELFSTILEGLADLPVNVVVTVGYDQDPAALGPQPPHVHVVGYVPVSLLLPHCSVVVTHGGSATVLAALGRGLPLLLVPQGYDQISNADRCVATGAGRSLRPEQLTAEAVRRDVTALLERPEFRDAAGRMQRELAAMPAPDEVVPVLEQLQREGQPLPRPTAPLPGG
jgi:UDP:flavonoid glycosyltransferase YjiC (YdhE family)